MLKLSHSRSKIDISDFFSFSLSSYRENINPRITKNLLEKFNKSRWILDLNFIVYYTIFNTIIRDKNTKNYIVITRLNWEIKKYVGF